MAVVTYLVRVLPLTLIRKEISNTYIKSFLYYVPYVTLAAMTFPAIIYSTSNKFSATIGFAVCIVLGYNKKSLITVALLGSLTVFVAETAMKMI
jgi:branched-subunit amino acid transport protein